MDGQAFGQMENSSTNEGLNSAEKAFYYFEKYDFFLGILTEIHEFLSLS